MKQPSAKEFSSEKYFLRQNTLCGNLITKIAVKPTKDPLVWVITNSQFARCYLGFSDIVSLKNGVYTPVHSEEKWHFSCNAMKWREKWFPNNVTRDSVMQISVSVMLKRDLSLNFSFYIQLPSKRNS